MEESGKTEAAAMEACEGEQSCSKSHEPGRKWAANGDSSAPDSGKSFAISGRNKSSDMEIGSLPGDLTTPPLTPPREPLTSEPVNGNRNNVSDHVHAHSANFKTTKQLESNVEAAKHPTETSEEPRGINGKIPTPRMDNTPPALVVIDDRKGLSAEDRGFSSDKDVEAEQKKPNRFQGDREATPSSNHSSSYPRSHDSATAEQGSLQSMQVTSAGHAKETASSDDEEMEDVELVLVEEQEEESEATRAAQSGAEVGSHDGAASESSSRRGHHYASGAVVNGMETSNGRYSATEHSKKQPSELGSASLQGGGGPHRRKGEMPVARTMTNVKQAAKVKQFFTTIQQHGNKLGSEVAEQVQELIHALMNETATVEEFHQEIQTIMNYPLKDFIIPFLRDNIGYFRAELKESSQVLADVLGSSEIPTSSTVTLTPQLVDDELPVLPSSSSKHSTVPSIRTISSNSLTVSKTSSSSSAPRTSAPHSNSTPNHHGTGNSSQSHVHTGVSASGHAVLAHSQFTEEALDLQRQKQLKAAPMGVKRRRWSIEQGPATMSAEKDKELGVEKAMTKRLRSETGDVIITTPRAPPPPPLAYNHPPPGTHLVTVSQPPPATADNHVAYAPFPHEHAQRRPTGRGTILSEDWGHIDMMLTSIQGMLEKTRQSMAVLKDRVTTTHIEMERREHERDSIIQQRVNEAADKIQLQANEEKQRLLVDASKQMRDAVSAAKNELENKFQQMQALAIQEAIKENNVQSASKEHCWNCGRRATETCSGCNKARYCGTFCQHKDWANHMHHCASGVTEEVSREPKRVHHTPLPVSDRGTTSRGVPVVPAQQHHRTIAIPVSMISPQEVNLRLAPMSHSHQGHSELLIKTERT